MIFASLVGGGAISQMYYADRVIDLPFALIAVAISTTLLPYLSKNIDDEKINIINTSNNQINYGNELLLKDFKNDTLFFNNASKERINL